MTIDFKALAAVFPEEDIEWRISRGGVNNNEPWAYVLAYIDARAVMDRLDAVVGPGNWKDEYSHQDKAFMCGISIKVDGEWVTKYDGSEETDIEGFKGGISKSLVRCAVKWGIGRYLYRLGNLYADFNEVKRNSVGSYYAKLDGKEFYWLPPKLPKWAIPEENYQKRKQETEKAKEGHVEAFKANPENERKHLGLEIMQLCKLKHISDSELDTMIMFYFDKLNKKDLTIEEMQKLLSMLENG